MTHYVVVCPDKYCRAVSILSKRTKTATCRTCGSQYRFEKYKISYETDDHDDAITARTKLLAKLDDDGPSFEEIKEQGGLEEPDRLFSEEEMAQLYGYELEEDETDSRTPQEIVQDAVQFQDNPSREDVINTCIEDGLDEEKAEKLVTRLLQRGYAIENSGVIELL